MVYETGETEELQVDELIRDSIMSLGWVPARPARPGLTQQASCPSQVCSTHVPAASVITTSGAEPVP